jgi:hypothetical protein
LIFIIKKKRKKRKKKSNKHLCNGNILFLCNKVLCVCVGAVWSKLEQDFATDSFQNHRAGQELRPAVHEKPGSTEHLATNVKNISSIILYTGIPTAVTYYDSCL